MIFYRLWFDEKVFLNNGFKSHLEIIQSSTSFSYSVLFHILQTKVVVVSLSHFVYSTFKINTI